MSVQRKDLKYLSDWNKIKKKKSIQNEFQVNTNDLF